MFSFVSIFGKVLMISSVSVFRSNVIWQQYIWCQQGVHIQLQCWFAPLVFNRSQGKFAGARWVMQGPDVMDCDLLGLQQQQWASAW